MTFFLNPCQLLGYLDFLAVCVFHSLSLWDAAISEDDDYSMRSSAVNGSLCFSQRHPILNWSDRHLQRCGGALSLRVVRRQDLTEVAGPPAGIRSEHALFDGGHL